MKTKLILTLFFILIVATLLWGCGNAQPAEKSQSETSSAVAEETLTSDADSAKESVLSSESATEIETSAIVAESSTADVSEGFTSQQETATEESMTAKKPQPEPTEPYTKIKDREPQINFSDLE